MSEIPDLSSSAGVRILLKPRLSAAFIRCLVLVTGLISPARLNSPNIAVPFLTAISVLAEYRAAARAASMELSLNFMPPATFTYIS